MSEESTRSRLSPGSSAPHFLDFARARLKGPSVPESEMSEESTRPGLSPESSAPHFLDFAPRCTSPGRPERGIEPISLNPPEGGVEPPNAPG